MTNINKLKEASLLQGELKSLLEYHRITGDFVWISAPSKYHTMLIGQIAGGLDKHGYKRIKIKGYTYKAHRLAWLYIYGEFPSGVNWQIDHIDGDRSNNRIENLKLASPAENQKNKQSTSKNTSGITGVCRVKVPRPSGKIDWYWVATWRDKNGKKGEKRFNIETHGEEAAKQAAITHRAEQIRLLELNHGIVYSTRHGK